MLKRIDNFTTTTADVATQPPKANVAGIVAGIVISWLIVLVMAVITVAAWQFIAWLLR